jgi:DNA replication protein DnaC
MDMEAAQATLARIRAKHAAAEAARTPEERARRLSQAYEEAVLCDANRTRVELERIGDGMLHVPHHYRSVAPDYRDVGSGLYLFGTVGTGKTHIAAGIVRAYVEAHLRCRWVNVPARLNEQREGIAGGNATDTVASLVNCDLLVLDDIGVERPTDWSLETLHVLISQANDCDTPVVVTSNLTLSQLGKRLDDRIASRLAGMCEPVMIGGPDRRLAQRMRTGEPS